MLELRNEKMNYIKPLLNVNNAHFPLLKLILSGKKKSSVYVNCLEKPTTASIMSEDGWFYFLGSEDDEDFNNRLENILIQKIRKEKMSILWFGISENWRKRLETYNLLKIGDFPRIQYEFNYDNYIRHTTDIPPYMLESINEKNVNKVFNYSEDLKAFWGAEENFIKYGFGFILLDKENIVGHALSASVEDGEVEIDIQTNESYRGKGLAAYLVSHLIDECIERTFIPKWDCAANNIPSNKLAIKLGFKKRKEYPFSLITSK